MHRTYSMRNSRAPTASEIESPPPPPSTTKASRILPANKVGHTFRKNVAGTFSPVLSRKMAQLIKMEKNVLRSLEQVSKERMEVAKQISQWGEPAEDDVSDITDKLGVLIYEIGELEDSLVDRYDQYRLTIKSIRNIEASMQPSRDRKQKIVDEIARVRSKDPESPKLELLEQQLVRVEAESLVAEAQLSNVTRVKLKSAFTQKFDAIREHGEKMSLIASYGKHLLDLVDANPVTPGQTRPEYDGHLASSAIMTECEDALSKWTASASPLTAELSPAAEALSLQTRSQHQAEGDVDEELAFPDNYYRDGEEWSDPEHAGLEGEFGDLGLGDSDDGGDDAGGAGDGEHFDGHDNARRHSLHDADEHQIADDDDFHDHEEQIRETEHNPRHQRLVSPT